MSELKSAGFFPKWLCMNAKWRFLFLWYFWRKRKSYFFSSSFLGETQDVDWQLNLFGIYSAWNAFLYKQWKTFRWQLEYSPLHSEHKVYFLCQAQQSLQHLTGKLPCWTFLAKLCFAKMNIKWQEGEYST